VPEHIEIRKDLPSGSIIIHRPERRNALTPRSVSELQTAFHDLHGEQSVRGVILTGTGECFCSGTDLLHLHEQMQCPDPESFWQDEVPDALALLDTMLRFPKPVIAAVNGPVRGMGMALMLACDYVIAAERSTFALPEVHRGLLPGLAAPLLTRRCRMGFVNRFLMTGIEVNSETARAESVVDEIVADDLVWARSQQLISDFVAAAPTSLQLTKQLVNETISESLFTQLSIGAANTAAARSTEQARRGVEAFVEKNETEW